MPKAIVLQHVPHEGAGRLAALLDSRGFAREDRPLHDGAAVPRAAEPCDLLVIMGGPMGVGDIGDPRYPFLAREVDLLRARIASGAPTLGICLGAQLIAHAAGARVYRNIRPRSEGAAPERILEVGWAPTQFHHGTHDPALVGLGASEIMLHWHGDTFGLPAGSTLLASTPLCPHQAFRLGRAIYALQFHCEVDAGTVATWVAEDAEYVGEANGPDGGEGILSDTGRFIARHREVGDRLLGNILGEMGFAR